MTHVLVVGGFLAPHKRLHALGARLTFVNDADQLARFKPDDMKIYQRILGVTPGASTTEWIAILEAVHRIDPFTAIGAFHEMNQDRAAAIAEAFSLPFHASDVITHVRQKDQMRNRLRQTGVDPTTARQVASQADIVAFAAEFGYPLILKPLDGWASLGVSRIERQEEISAALDWFRVSGSQSTMLVEPYLQGAEYSVEAFSEAGQHRMLCITQKYKDPSHFVELGHVLPAPLSTDTAASITSFVQSALEALSIRDGATHTEVFFTADGPRIVETHTRLGGDNIPDLIQLTSGIDLLDLWARQVLGERVLPLLPARFPTDSYAAIWYVMAEQDGRVVQYDGVDAAQQMDGVVRVDILKGPGSTIRKTFDSYSRLAYVVATGRTANEAIGRAQKAAGSLRVNLE